MLPTSDRFETLELNSRFGGIAGLPFLNWATTKPTLALRLSPTVTLTILVLNTQCLEHFFIQWGRVVCAVFIPILMASIA